MKRSLVGFIGMFLVLLAAAAPRAAQPLPARQTGEGPESGAGTEDKTLSPYFFVKSEDPSVDRLPLKSTSARARISGVIADVEVVQVYRNEGTKPIEAVYVFPASTRAAVHGMKMTIGERVIVAEIRKRDEARQVYETAKAEGRSASLLEQQRPNVFQMNVANILPGDEIRTELRYTELLVPTEGVYEFTYPTVVGPRYSNQAEATAPPSEKWSQNPFLHEGEAPPYTFGIEVDLSAGVPISEMTCPSHKANIRYGDKTTASVTLDPGEKAGGNRDFILKYRLRGEAVQSGLLLFEGEKENFFLLMTQPPARVTEADTPPREYVFIVDVSGSMNGYPLDISKRLLKDLVGGLRPVDRFNVLLFAGGTALFSEKSVAADANSVRRAVELIERQRGGGGTELLPALKRALALPRVEGMSRSFVIATDGYVTVEPEVFDLVRKHIGDANFFPFGIGTSVNRHLIEGMARVGAGEPFVITRADEAPEKAARFRRYVGRPVLTGVKLDFGGFNVYDVEPPAVPDLFAERPVVVYGKWRGTPKGTIRLSGTSGGKPHTASIDVSAVRPSADNAALRYLWARSTIARLSDYNLLAASDERVKQVTDLGLGYSLLTAHTSFVAVDSEVRRQGGETTTVKQPLPLPAGVSNYAVGGSAPSLAMGAPPPASRPMMAREAAPVGKGGGAEWSFRKKVAQQVSENDTAASSARAEEGKADKAADRRGIVIEQVTVTGSLPEADVKRVIERHRAEIEDCLREGRAGTRLKLTISWTIRADGTVTDIRVASGAGAVPRAVEACIRKKMTRWFFPKPADARAVKVTAVIGFAG